MIFSTFHIEILRWNIQTQKEKKKLQTKKHNRTLDLASAFKYEAL